LDPRLLTRPHLHATLLQCIVCLIPIRNVQLTNFFNFKTKRFHTGESGSGDPAAAVRFVFVFCQGNNNRISFFFLLCVCVCIYGLFGLAKYYITLSGGSARLVTSQTPAHPSPIKPPATAHTNRAGVFVCVRPFYFPWSSACLL